MGGGDWKVGTFIRPYGQSFSPSQISCSHSHFLHWFMMISPHWSQLAITHCPPFSKCFWTHAKQEFYVADDAMLRGHSAKKILGQKPRCLSHEINYVDQTWKEDTHQPFLQMHLDDCILSVAFNPFHVLIDACSYYVGS